MNDMIDDLRTAAQILLDLADETDDEIKTNPCWHSRIAPESLWFAHGIDDAVGGPGGLLAGLLSPEAARGLAKWMRDQADFADGVIEAHGYLTEPALRASGPAYTFATQITLTRKILGGTR
ncbi:hypothetical protein ACFYM2_21285 [Streptomyces sp. NPDC006711]|uniref:hypothetical protein n=1 Tax=Streptomyces sp. NPDC006711 TaxID=3364762 RepID=UPI0036C1C39E